MGGMLMEKNTSEYNYGKDISPRHVLRKSGPAGLLVLLCFVVVVIGILALLLWRMFG
jgi:hypothetical protein